MKPVAKFTKIIQPKEFKKKLIYYKRVYLLNDVWSPNDNVGTF